MTAAAGTISVIGFDSAWTDNPKAPGAICVLRFRPAGGWRFFEPELARFDEALAAIEAEAKRSQRCIVAIDQPTIVPNLTGARPADRVVASLLSFIGGGVQPAFRAKTAMFGDGAPIWRFKAALGASDDAERARTAMAGRFLFEVFPALALASFHTGFHARQAQPKYNPAVRNKFQHAHWVGVVQTVAAVAGRAGIAGIADWCDRYRQLAAPRKADQDRLDAVICALIGQHWLTADRQSSILIGDPHTGYMIAPASPAMRLRLQAAARKLGVMIDGAVPELGEASPFPSSARA